MKLRHQMMLMCLTALVVLVAAGKDYYKVLGVKKKATNRQLKKAYRKLALENHPDKVAEDQKEQAKKRFIDISEAYDVLSDPEKRRNYDQFGSADGAAGGAGFGGGGGGFHSGFNMDPFEMFNDFFGGGGGGGGHQEFKFGGGGNSGGFGGFGGFGAGAGGFGGGAGGFGGQKPLTRLYEKDSNVRTLSKNKFPRSKKANNEWLVQFYSLSNQASIKLKDTVESIANDLKNKVKVGAINCDKNKVFCLQMGVHKYPAFKYYWAGEATDYEGDLTDEYEIYNFAISKHLKRLQELRDRGEPEKLHKSSQKKLCNIGSDASNKVSVTCAIFVLSSNPAKWKREMEAVIALNKKFRKFRGVQLSWTDKQTQALKKLKVSPSSSVPALVILKLKRGKLRGAVFSSKFTVEELSKTFDRLQGGDLTLKPLKDLRIDFR